MGTFHSIFLRILHAEAARIGFTSKFTIYDTADSKSLLRSIIKEMGLDEKVYKPGMVQSRISNAKNTWCLLRLCQQQRSLRSDCAAKMPALRDIYRRYWERCRQADAMDFDDLLFYTFLLFRDHPDVLARYQSQFRYILVDEYQDTTLPNTVLCFSWRKNISTSVWWVMMRKVFILSGGRILITFCILQRYIRVRKFLSWNKITVPPKRLSLQPTV